MGTRAVTGRSPFSWISVLIVLALASPASASTPSQASYDVAELLVEADRLDLEGRWQEAESAYARAIEAAEKTLGPRDPLVARALIGAADLRARMDPDHPSAFQMIERAKEILGGELPSCAAAVSGNGYGHNIARARECLAEAEERTGPDSVETAQALNRIGLTHFLDVYFFAIVPADLRDLAERALEANTRVFGPEHPAVGWSELFLGTALGSARACDESHAHLDRALGVFERTLGPDAPPAAVTLYVMATTCTPPPEETASLMGRSVLSMSGRCEQEGEIVWTYAGWCATALVRRVNEGDADGAEAVVRLYPAAVQREAGRVGASDGCRALARGLEGIWAGLVGDAASAARIYRDMESQLIAAYGPAYPMLGQILNELAFTQWELLNDRDQAIVTARRAVAVADREGVSPYLRGLVLNALALSLYPEDDAERQDLQRRAIEQWTILYGPDSVQAAMLRAVRGYFAEQRGDLETARTVWEEAYASPLSSLAYPGDCAAERLGVIDFQLGRLEEAEARLIEAAEYYAKYNPPQSPIRFRTAATLAAVRAARGDRAGAFDLSLGAQRVVRGQIRVAARGAPERVVLKILSTSRWGIDLALALSDPGLPASKRASLYDEVIRGRAMVLDEISGRRRLAALAGDPATSALAAEVAKYAMRLANLTVSGSADEKLMALWRERKERAEEGLALKSASFARSLASEKAGLEEVRKALPADAALVSFVRYDADAAKPRPSNVPPDAAGPGGAYVAFALPPGSEAPVLVLIGPASKVDAAVEEWRSRIVSVSSERSVRESGARLRRLVWDPVAKHLGEAKRALIVPDGSLNFVSFGALPAREGRYLVETGPEIHLVAAERDLAVPRDPPTRSEEMLVVGNPAFEERGLFTALREGTAPVQVAALDAPLGLEEEVAQGKVFLRGRRSSCGSFASLRFETLPGSEEEARAVATLGGDRAHTLTGTAAAEGAIKSEMPRHRVAHLATHGFFLGGECEAGGAGSRGIGAIVPAAGGKPKAVPPRPRERLENPLLFSGVALAGANHRDSAGPDEEDGILTAEEIAALDLSNVEWAVLSACETGVGDIKTGEGVFGLRRAFQVAGAHTLISSLWAVDDESTREWMTALYEGQLKDKLDTAEAVRRASLKVLERRRAAKQSTHPFHWAAFVASGDWR